MPQVSTGKNEGSHDRMVQEASQRLRAQELENTCVLREMSAAEWTHAEVVGSIHPKAMTVILRSQEPMAHWWVARWGEASRLQRSFPDDGFEIVAGPIWGRTKE
jgi:hypothetical protein